MSWQRTLTVCSERMKSVQIPPSEFPWHAPGRDSVQDSSDEPIPLADASAGSRYRFPPSRSSLSRDPLPAKAVKHLEISN